MDDFLALSLKRLNRSSYFLSIFLSMFLFVGTGLLLDAIILGLTGFSLEKGEPVGIFLIFSQIAWFIYASYCIVRRFHDFGMSGWWVLAAFVPFLNIFLGFKLLFFKGNQEKNEYGEPIDGTFIMGFGYRL